MPRSHLSVPLIEDSSAGSWLARALGTIFQVMRHPIEFWDDVYRGEGIGKPLGLAFFFCAAGLLFILLMAKLGLDATHRSAGIYSGMLLVTFYTTFPAQIALFLLSPLLETFIFGGMAALVLRPFGAGEGTFGHTSRLSIYAYLAMLPIFSILIGLSVYLSANPIGALNFFGAGDILVDPAAIQKTQTLTLAVMLMFLAPGALLRIFDFIAIKKTLGSRTTWMAAIVSGVVATLAMWMVTFLLGQAASRLTVQWIMGLRREAPLSAVEKVILAPTQRPVPQPVHNPDQDIKDLIRETGLEEPLIQGLLDLDDTLDLRNKWVDQFTHKMLRRYRKAYAEINRIYDEAGIPDSSPLRIPRLERVLRPYRPGFKQDTMKQIPDQLSKTNMVWWNCEKNLGAVCGGILTVVDGQKPGAYCRHQGWERINGESMAWAERLKASHPGPKEQECLMKVRSVIDNLLTMESNYQTNSRDYPG